MVGIQTNENSRELLNWALAKVAEPGDRVVAVHVCQDSDSHTVDNSSDICHSLDSYLAVKAFHFTEHLGHGNGNCIGWDTIFPQACQSSGTDLMGTHSNRKVLEREAKLCAAKALVVGISKFNALRGSLSLARYCAKKLPSTTSVLAVHEGKVVFPKDDIKQSSGLKRNRWPSFHGLLRLSIGDDTKVLNPSHKEIPDDKIPKLLKAKNLAFRPVYDSEDSGRRNIKEIASEQGSMITEKYDGTETGSFSSCAIQTAVEIESVEEVEDEGNHLSQEQKDDVSCSNSIRKLPEDSSGWPLLQRTVSANFEVLRDNEARDMSVIQWVMSLPNRSMLFTPQSQIGLESHRKDLHQNRSSTASSLSTWLELPKELETLIATCSTDCRVFSCEELETSITHISPDDVLISIYKFFQKGSLEEHLHGEGDKSILPWEVRFKVAVGVAEALTYLHRDCSRPVIHRDVKSSNVLLSHEFEPQLSDFGLALWAPTSAFVTHTDVVGTFGYLAPEYFMYGQVSEKIDVYSYGVVPLELLSRRKPINTENPKRQESLVMWVLVFPLTNN